MKTLDELNDEKSFRELLFVQKLDRIKKYIIKFRKLERDDFRRDAKSVLCRGISETEVNQVQKGINLEDTFFYLSRIYIPCAFFYGYKVGHFEDRISSGEIRRVIKYGIHMYLIAAVGHALLRYYATPIIEKHRGFSEYELHRKANDDFLIQRNYFKETQMASKNNTGSLLKK